MSIELKFRFPVATLSAESDLILTAAQSQRYAPKITERVDDTIVTEGRTIWNGLFKPPVATPPPESEPSLSAAQKRASGAVGEWTALQEQLRDRYKKSAAKARDAAKDAFKGQDVKLHDEFRVGVQGGNGIAQVIAEGRLLIAAVRNSANVGPLKQKGGYIQRDADELAETVEQLATSETSQEEAKGGAKGAIDLRNEKLNRLFEITTLIQNAAANEFTDRESQTAFRIGTFPPKRSKKEGDDTAPASTPQPPKP